MAAQAVAGMAAAALLVLATLHQPVLHRAATAALGLILGLVTMVLAAAAVLPAPVLMALHWSVVTVAPGQLLLLLVLL
jgi:hypothetical protein